MDIHILLKDYIKKAVESVYSIKIEDVLLEHPENEKFGDYSTNISLVLTKDLRKSPFEIAQDIIHEIENYDIDF